MAHGAAVNILTSLDNPPDAVRGGAVAIGNFDGVHLGHAEIVRQLVCRAREVGGPAVVLTFDPHPVRLLRPQHAPPPLTWTARKAALLGQLGVDTVVAYPTDEAFLDLSPRQFFHNIVRERLAAQSLVEGVNFFFGRDRLGNVDLLRRFCGEAGVSLDVVEPISVDGQMVSSSRIRALVAQGQIDAVRRLLTQPYRIRGTVVHGAARGARLGFPTANLGGVDTLLPGEGIYAGRAWSDGAVFPAAISVGANPTFGERALKIEAYLLDYSGSLYDRTLEIDFLARLRDTQRFDSVDALLAQMNQDVQRVREIAGA